ncbi:MAG: P-loop NTPase [Coriobacteriales bacterium]|jgi:Mrp family chromosome partitioning ATPase
MGKVVTESGHEYNIPGMNEPEYAPLQPDTRVEKLIGVVSGKGGVGKSLVTSLLATKAQRSGLKTAILDADITGPSIPRAFGLNGFAGGPDGVLHPANSRSGIKAMSLNLLMKNDTDPVIWRGPIISNMVTQFWSEIAWGDIDVMFIDMPPGTGDVALTIFQNLPLDGLVIVSSPQELVGMIVEKAVNMANRMEIPILGLVENMSYVECPDCGKQIRVFGESHLDAIAAKHGIENTASLPIDAEVAHACDTGAIEDIERDWLDAFFDKLMA